MKKKHSHVNSYATHKELAGKQPRITQRTCCRVNSHTPHEKTLAGKQLRNMKNTCSLTVTQHEKHLFVNSYAEGKLPVNSYAIFLGATFELSGLNEGRVRDSS